MENEQLVFESLLIKTDVTAIKIINSDYVAIGIGNALNLYKIPTKNLVKKLEVFIGQKIHGFVQSSQNNKLAIYGGKQIKISSLDFETDIIISIDKIHIQCDDWILALIWIKNNTEFALLTAHNIVQIWNTGSNTLKSTFKCEEKCILYSGLLKEINDYVVVFAGTVFSQIVLWDTRSENVLNRIIGHKGVIFSISYNKTNNLIVTTSDDRSVKLWSIDSENDQNYEQYWSNVKISCKVTLFGHTARVMRHVTIGNYIISIGEDSLMCIWHIDGSLLKKQKIHQEAPLWCLDCDINDNIIVTGGGDSGVMIHRLESDLNNLNDQIRCLNLPNATLVPKSVAVTARNNIVCLTEQGELTYYDVEINEWQMHETTDTKPQSLSISICRQFIGMTDINGHLTILAETCKFDPKLVLCISQKISDGRIPSLIWLPDRKLCTCDKNGVITIWSSRADKCSKLNEFYLPVCKERWLTVAVIVTELKNLLIVGDRCGNVHLYDEKSVNPIQTITKVHGRLGTNYIRVAKHKIITVGRDSTVKYFNIAIDEVSGKPDLQFLNYVKLPFNWVDRFVGKDDSLLCGFCETDLVIWNLPENRHLLELNCGGGHRSWDIVKNWKKCTNSTEHTVNICLLQFIFIKNGKVQTVDINMNNISQNIIRGFHTKEINSLLTLRQENNKFLFISGGEDTSLIFNQCEVNEQNINFINQFKVNKHLSSIRCLCSYQSEDKYVIFSAGGRAQICAWELNIAAEKFDIFDCREISNYLLKGSDLQRKGNTGWKQIKMDVDAETRIMCLACINSTYFPHIESTDDIVLFAGCSDGFLRVYLVKHNFELLGCYTSNCKCILRIDTIIFESRPVVFTTSTDGTISIWDFCSVRHDKVMDPIHTMRIHKAGINSLDISCIDKNKYIVATGGDDNDLQLNVISLEVEHDVLYLKEVCKWHCDKYHCSQITGTKMLNNTHILSTSIDQRVTVLRLNYVINSDTINIDCQYVGQYHANISDIQGMTVLNHNRKEALICVYGKGIEVIKINNFT